MNKILIISSHTDDGELSAGGTIARLVEEEKQITHIVFSSCSNEELVKEFRAANATLGITDVHIYNFKNRTFSEHRQEILDILIQQKEKVNPDCIFTHGDIDTHQDHQVVHMESMRAFKDRTIIGYNHPWNARIQALDFYVKIGRKHLDVKIAAIRHYASQSHRHYTNPEYIEAQALSVGGMIAERYAEGFQILNHVM